MQTAEIRKCQTGLKIFQNFHRSNLQTLTCLFATNRTGMFSVTGWSRNSFRTAEFSWSRSSVADESTTQTMTWIFFTNSFQYFLHNSDPPTTNKIIETIFEEVIHDHIRIERVCVCVCVFLKTESRITSISLAKYVADRKTLAFGFVHDILILVHVNSIPIYRIPLI